MRRIILLILAAAAILMSACADAPSPAPQAATGLQEPLSHAGRWITDAGGRVLIVHGVNVPSKTLPAYPAALNFDASHAAFLASLGFNAVRVTVERYAVEPAPGQFDATYVGHIADTINTLTGFGILTLIDFHQDDFGTEFLDNGYPPWMTVTDGLPNIYAQFPLQYFENPALNRAFDHLWQNDPDTQPKSEALQADDAGILSFVAAKLGGLRGILGYEIINEPWPGSRSSSCVSFFAPFTGCPAFDSTLMSAYYNRMIPAVRAADGTHLIWYEPLQTFNWSTSTHLTSFTDPNLGFAFHDYNICSLFGCNALQQDAAVLSNAIARSSMTGDALLETEFGATLDTSVLAGQVALYDQNMMPWLFWSYTRYIDPYASDGTLLPPTPANVNSAIVDVVARPYPQLVSGTPISWSFDPSSDVFMAQYSTSRADGRGSFPAGSETDFVAPAVQYPNGYGVSVAGGMVISPPGAGVLKVTALEGASTVTVTISPASH